MSIFFSLILGTHKCPDCRIIKREEFNDVKICPACRQKEKDERLALDRLPLEAFIREVVNGRAEITDSKNHNYSLYEKYFEEMPYGTAKARDGDPDLWMFDRLMDDYEHLIEEEEKTV